MNAASHDGETRRIVDLNEIIDLIGRNHPHVVGNGWLTKMLERKRIKSAIWSQESEFDFCLVTLRQEADSPQCGVLAAVPKPEAEAKFASNGSRPMLFGFLFGFACQQHFDKVMQDVVRLAQERRRETLVGPFEATINYSCGLLDAEPAFPLGMMMPSNPLFWRDYLSSFGFSIAERLFTFEIDIPNARFRRIGSRAAQELGLAMRQLHLPFSPEDKAAICDVFNSGWQDNWGFVPIDSEYVDALAREFRPILWPGLCWLVYRGDKAVGVAIAAPDIAELTRGRPGPVRLAARLWKLFARHQARALRIFVLGLSSDMHRSAAGASVVEMIIDEGRAVAERYSARYLQVGWTLSSNHRINRMIRHWAPDAPCVVHTMWTLAVPPTPEPCCRSSIG